MCGSRSEVKNEGMEAVYLYVKLQRICNGYPLQSRFMHSVTNLEGHFNFLFATDLQRISVAILGIVTDVRCKLVAEFFGGSDEINWREQLATDLQRTSVTKRKIATDIRCKQKFKCPSKFQSRYMNLFCNGFAADVRCNFKFIL